MSEPFRGKKFQHIYECSSAKPPSFGAEQPTYNVRPASAELVRGERDHFCWRESPSEGDVIVSRKKRLPRPLEIKLTGWSAETLMLSYMVCSGQLDGADNQWERVNDIDDEY